MRANTIISWLTALLVLFLAGAAFILSYDALHALAQANGVKRDLAWLWPLTLDAFMIASSLAVLRASLNRERTWYPWILVGLFTLASIAFNVLHAPETWLARAVFALPPAVVFLSFELLMGQTGAAVKRQGVIAALADLLAQLDTRRAEANALVNKVAELVSRRDVLQAEIAELRKTRNTASLGSLDDANAARAADKANAMDALLIFYRDHPHASLSEAGKAIGRSKATAGNYLKEMEEAGKVHKNGNGWQVA
jgi:hypothetical protein